MPLLSLDVVATVDSLGVPNLVDDFCIVLTLQGLDESLGGEKDFCLPCPRQRSLEDQNQGGSFKFGRALQAYKVSLGSPRDVQIEEHGR